ncbi:MAG: phosphatidate cytidylyltransferase [Chromatiaceae bacterium]|nr:phosphatidate cytidylyltransferase [Chromatiaceae bacterium]
MTSLQSRVLTASILAPVAILAVLALPPSGFALALGLILLGAAWEWSALGGLTASAARLGYVVLIGTALILLWFLPEAEVAPLLLLVSLWWWLVAVWLFRLNQIEPGAGPAPGRLLAGLLALTGPWLAMTQLHGASPRGPALVLFLLLLIWTADIAAYFSGRRWGRTKLAPVLSPGKTWEGVLGAGAGAALLGLALGYWLDLAPLATLGALILCLTTAFISVVGDLFESLLKRRQGVKDSGHLLPGHGGLLDRIDSLTAAAPFFVLGLIWLGVPT